MPRIQVVFEFNTYVKSGMQCIIKRLHAETIPRMNEVVRIDGLELPNDLYLTSFGFFVVKKVFWRYEGNNVNNVEVVLDKYLH